MLLNSLKCKSSEKWGLAIKSYLIRLLCKIIEVTFPYRRNVCYLLDAQHVWVHSSFFYPSKHQDLCPGYTGLTSLFQGPRHPSKIRDFMSLCTNDVCIGQSESRVMEQINFSNWVQKSPEVVGGGSRVENSVIRTSGHTHPPQVNRNSISLMCFLGWFLSRISF